MSRKPLGTCDFCNKIYYGGESILRIKNITVHDLFKLEICNSKCHSNIIKEYPFISSFRFDEYIVKVKNSSSKEIIIKLLKNYHNYVINKKTKCIKSAPEIMSEYLTIKNKTNKTQLDQNYLDFCNNNDIFTY